MPAHCRLLLQHADSCQVTRACCNVLCCGDGTPARAVCKADLFEANDVEVEEGAVVDDLPLNVLVDLQAGHLTFDLLHCSLCKPMAH